MNDERLYVIATKYPSPIANIFKAAANFEAPEVKHKTLLELAEVTISYLALVAWSEYRVGPTPSEKVEAVLTKVRKPSMGNWLELFRTVLNLDTNRLLRSSILEPFDPSTLTHASEFVRLWKHVNSAIEYEIPTHRMADFIRKQSTNKAPKVTLLGFLDALVHCRNRYAHPQDPPYPKDNILLEIINTPLFDALLEWLLLEPVQAALLNHVWAVSSNDPTYSAKDKSFITKFTMNFPTAFAPVTLRTSQPLPHSILLHIADNTPYIPFDFELGWPKAWNTEESSLFTDKSQAQAQGLPPTDSTVSLNINLTEFRQDVADAAEDGVFSSDELKLLERRRIRLGITEAQAKEIILSFGLPLPQASHPNAAPVSPLSIPVINPIVPVVTSNIRFRSPATQTAHDGEVCFELLCDGFSHVRLRAENNLIATVEASPVTVIKRVFKRTGQWRTLIAEGLDASDNILATETIEILPRDPVLSGFIKQIETTSVTSAKVAYALTDAVARLKIVANVKSSAGMRFPDPANKESLFTLFALSSDGRVYTSGLEKIKDTGYPPELVETYQRTLNTLADMNIESSGFGRGGVELSKVEPWVDAFVVAVSTLVAGLVAAAKTDIAAPGIKMAAQALGMKGRQLDQELTAIATQAILEDWSTVRMAIGSTEQPTLHWAPMVTTLNEGRVGVNIGGGDRSWKPGLYAGVLFNPADHHTSFSRPDLGADFVVLVSVTRWDKAFDADKFMATPEFVALRKRLSQDAGGWSFCDQLSLEKPNRWHPIHLRRPLVEVFAGSASPEERYEAWMKASKDALRVILQGGELQTLRERYFTSEGAKSSSVVTNKSIHRYGDITIDLDNYVINHPDGVERLSNREQELLRYFITHQGKIIKQEELLLEFWKTTEGTTRSLSTHVFTIRKKLRDDPDQPRFIKTLHGIGFKFVGEESG